MNRFNLLTYTAALAMALCACVSNTKSGPAGSASEQMSLMAPPAVGSFAKS